MSELFDVMWAFRFHILFLVIAVSLITVACKTDFPGENA